MKVRKKAEKLKIVNFGLENEYENEIWSVSNCWLCIALVLPAGLKVGLGRQGRRPGTL